MRSRSGSAATAVRPSRAIVSVPPEIGGGATSRDVDVVKVGCGPGWEPDVADGGASNARLRFFPSFVLQATPTTTASSGVICDMRLIGFSLSFARKLRSWAGSELDLPNFVFTNHVEAALRGASSVVTRMRTDARLAEHR